MVKGIALCREMGAIWDVTMTVIFRRTQHKQQAKCSVFIDYKLCSESRVQKSLKWLQYGRAERLREIKRVNNRVIPQNEGLLRPF